MARLLNYPIWDLMILLLISPCGLITPYTFILFLGLFDYREFLAGCPVIDEEIRVTGQSVEVF